MVGEAEFAAGSEVIPGDVELVDGVEGDREELYWKFGVA